MKYEDFKEFWQKANSLKDAECHELRLCGGCPLQCVSEVCSVVYPEEMTEEQFNLIQNYEVAEEIDWTTVPIDAKILVWDYFGDSKARRYFARYADGVVYTWKDGATSFSVDNVDDVIGWRHGQLYEES